MMNAFEMLKKDHEKVAGIFEKLEKTTERGVKTREELFTQLKFELDIHAEIEETILYPALKEAEQTRDLTLESFEEHRLVKRLLMELEQMPKDNDQWAAKLKVLQENVEHHVEEEETELFPAARKVLSKEEMAEIGTQMMEAKKPMVAAAKMGTTTK
jgi:hemerythrin-like domain-containing protein